MSRLRITWVALQSPTARIARPSGGEDDSATPVANEARIGGAFAVTTYASERMPG
ncbi:MAG: hypothetical protein JXB13_02135 [Phycisphaerae bacterium]|nr:hypothetical protein [Phycisphaerae bacterium]